MQSYPFWVFDASGIAGNVLFSIFDPVLGFSSTSAPEINAELRQVKPGNWEYPRQVFKAASVSPITMARGTQFFDSDFYNWITNTIRGKQPVRRNLVIVHYLTFRPLRSALGVNGGSSGIGPELGVTSPIERVPGRAWVCYDCLPTRYKAGTDFDAKSSDVSIQELEVQPEHIIELTISTLSPLTGRAISAGIGIANAA
jgi:phage tail-like protein